MKKFLSSILMISVLLGGLFILPQSSSAAHQDLKINGQQISSQDYVIYKGVTYVNFTEFAKYIGASVAYNSSTKEVTIAKHINKLILKPYSLTATYNGKSIKLKNGPILENNKTFIPLKEVSKRMDVEISIKKNTINVKSYNLSNVANLKKSNTKKKDIIFFSNSQVKDLFNIENQLDDPFLDFASYLTKGVPTKALAKFFTSLKMEDYFLSNDFFRKLSTADKGVGVIYYRSSDKVVSQQ